MNSLMNPLMKLLKENRTAIYIAISLIIGLVIGITICNWHKIFEPETIKTESHEKGYSFISPLLECFSESSDSPKNYQLQEEIKGAISKNIKEKKITEASVYFRDLANGPWIGIGEDKKFTPASLLKVPMAITYYKLAEKNPDILNKKILITSDYDNQITQNIKAEKKVEQGKEYTVQELINYMIIESDNRAANALISNIPENNVNKTFNDLGLVLPSVDTPENYMTVKDYSSFFRVLYNASYLNKDYSEKLLYILSESKYKNGLVAGIPADVKVSHKFGERRFGNADQLHDCGIIYKKDKNYLLCIMTRGNDFDNLSKTIQELSKLVYESVN